MGKPNKHNQKMKNAKIKALASRTYSTEKEIRNELKQAKKAMGFEVVISEEFALKLHGFKINPKRYKAKQSKTVSLYEYKKPKTSVVIKQKHYKIFSKS